MSMDTKEVEKLNSLYARVEQLEAFRELLKSRLRVEKVEPEQLFTPEVRDIGTTI